MNNYFIFNGKDSRDFDIQLGEYPPIVKPRERIETITVPGRSGTLHVKEDEYIFDSYIKPFNIVALNPAKIDEIIDWLQGSGEIIIGNENDWIYDGYISDAIEFTRFFRGWHKATVSVEVQPFKKSRRVYTHELMTGNVDNWIQCNSDYPTPYVIDIMQHPWGLLNFQVNDNLIRSILEASDDYTGWVQVISKSGIVKYQTEDDPLAPIKTYPLVMKNQKATLLNKGTNNVKFKRNCLGPVTISYRNLQI